MLPLLQLLLLLPLLMLIRAVSAATAAIAAEVHTTCMTAAVTLMRTQRCLITKGLAHCRLQ
jgi:hypothetical protein